MLHSYDYVCPIYPTTASSLAVYNIAKLVLEQYLPALLNVYRTPFYE